MRKREIRMPDEMYTGMVELAKRRGVSIASAVRNAIQISMELALEKGDVIEVRRAGETRSLRVESYESP